MKTAAMERLMVMILLCLRLYSCEKISLHFSYITTKTGSFVISGAIPAVDLALEQINNSTEILPKYTLSYTTILDSKCDGTASLDSFFEHFRNDSGPTYVSLYCCGCSTATISVAEISHYWNIPQVAGMIGANELNNRQRFRGFYRTDGSHEFVGAALAQMARDFNWTQMAIISQEESLFLRIAESLDSIFKSENRVVDKSIVLDKNAESFPYHLLDNLAEGDFRIIVLNTAQSDSYTILCEAYSRGWLPPKYVWFTYGWYNNYWWEEEQRNTSCTSEVLKKMLNGSLVILPINNLMSEDRDTETFSGLSPKGFKQEYKRRLGEERYQALNLSEYIVAESEFDAIWVMASGLHSTSEKVRRNDSSGCDHLPGELTPLEEFEYRNDLMGCVLRNSFQEVNFRGITGPIMFNSNGSRDASVIRVEQYHVEENGRVERPTMAYVVISMNSSKLMFKENAGVMSLWQDGAPYDGAAREGLHQNSAALVSVYSVAASAGIMCAVVCLLFNIIFRNRKVVKLSSRNINYLVIAGATLLYGSVFLYILSERDYPEIAHEFLCNFRQWSFSLGYTLCFAVILAKTWRIYYIFSNPMPKKKVPKDWFLFVIVVAVVAGDILIILIGTATPSLRFTATRIADIQHPVSLEDGINYRDYVFICLNNNAIVWLAISYGYKGLLQLVAMFMAFHTRRVKIKTLNDSKEIAVIIYINSIILALLAVVEFALSKHYDVHAALFGLALLVGPTVFLLLVFVPKMVHLYKDPEGKNALEPSSIADTNPSSRHKFASKAEEVTDYISEIATLKQEISGLEKQLAEVDTNDRKARNEN